MNGPPRNFLVTGAAGFIGANFVRHTHRARPAVKIVALDALTYAGNRANLAGLEASPRFTFVHGDIRNRELVADLLRQHEIDTVVHFAAESHVDRSIAEPDAFVETNVLGTHVLLSACRRAWLGQGTPVAHRFHHVSTDEVYGSLGPSDAAFHETTPYAPSSPYSASKAGADHLVRAYAHTYGLETTITNCSNNYGPYQYPEKLIPLMIVRILEGGPLPVYGDGRNVRDWLFVDDHCQGIDLVIHAGRPGQTYNIGGGTEMENLQLVQRLCAIADAEFAARPELRERFPRAPASRGEPSATLLQFVPDRPGHDRRYAIDANKISRELGYSAATSLAAGLRHTFLWYLENETWWRAFK